MPGEETSTSQYARARAEALALKQRVIAKFDFVPAGLQELNLRGNMLGDRGIVLLASVLEQDRMIRVLDLARTGFGEIGAVALGAAMENMGALEWLSLEWNLIGSGKGALGIATGLRNSITLKCLDISECSLGDKGGSFIASALAENEVLQEIDLGSNRLSRETAEVGRCRLNPGRCWLNPG